MHTAPPPSAAHHAPVVLVTGASTGIGMELVRRLALGPWTVVATARDSSLSRFGETDLRESPNLLIRPLDVTDEEQRNRLVAELESRFGAVDALVNNAGASWRSVTEHMPDGADEDQMRLNYHGPLALVRRVLPAMRARRLERCRAHCRGRCRGACRCRIVNISSVGGMMAMPTMGAYSASKFALEGASESLWYELRPWGISVTLVQPGFVHSESFNRVLLPERGRQALMDPADPYHAYYRHMTDFVTRLMTRSSSSAAEVACRIERVLRHPDPPLRVAGTRDARFFYLLRRLLPRALYHRILYRNLPHIQEWGPRP
jgi:NAD(P)-dependent dehydrogenase (short-subunit alcohol dehydrogenase family)